jgi:hypothetical protein
LLLCNIVGCLCNVSSNLPVKLAISSLKTVVYFI